MSAATFELVIDWMGRPLTSNQERRMHWRQKAQVCAAWRSAGATAAMVAKVPPLGLTAVTVRGRYARGVMPDPDAIAPAVKRVIDGLVDRGVWPDDTAAHVASITYLPPLKAKGVKEALIVSLSSLDAGGQADA